MNNIPNVLKPIPTNMPVNQQIFTSVLEAETKSQRRALFTLRNQGLLSPKSRLVFSVCVNDQTTSDNGNAFLPINIGANACIDRCRLLIGSNVVAETQSYPHLFSAHSSTHENCDKKLIDMPLYGSVDNVSCSPLTDGKYAVDVASGIYLARNVGQVADRYKLKKSPLETPEWSIALEDMFPFLRGVLLPLQFITLPVSVEVDFTQQGENEIGKVCCFSGTPPKDKSIVYDLDNLNLHIDYLQFDENYMNETRDKIYGEGIVLRYDDLKTTTTNMDQVTQPATGVDTENDIVREIMSAGLLCKDVIVTEQKDTNELDTITITSGGSGYISVPSVAITGGNGSGATGSITLDTQVQGEVLENAAITAGGSGYSGSVSVSIGAPTGVNKVQATATATIASGAVNSITLTNAGNGYLVAPSVSITGGGGSGATASVSVKAGGGNIMGITILNKGTGFTSPPTIAITGGGGSGATASSTITHKSNPLLGDYDCLAPIHPSKINFRYNNEVVYQTPLENTSLKRNEVQDVLQFPINTPSVIYSTDVENDFYTSKDGGQNPIMDTGVSFEGHSPANLSGTKHFTGLQLRKTPQGRGTMIENTNIRYERHNTYSHNDYEKRTLRFYTKYERIAMLKDGDMIVSA